MRKSESMIHSCSRGRYHKFIVWVLMLGVVIFGAMAQSALANFEGGGTSGQFAKLEFRLRESFHPTSIAWSPDGRYIATGSTDSREIHIWEVSRRRMIKRLLITTGIGFFHQLSWSPDGEYLAACDAPGVLRVYRTTDWTEAQVLSGPPHLSGCNHSAISSDSKLIAMIGVRSLNVFAIGNWRLIKSLDLIAGWGRGDLFNTVAYLPRSDTVLIGGGQYVTIPFYGKNAGGWDGRVWFFASGDRVPSRSIRAYRADDGGGGAVHSLTVDPGGQFIVTGAKTGAGNQSAGFATESVHILNTSDGSLVAAPLDRLPPLKFGSEEGLAYSHDSRYIIVAHGGDEGWIHILDGRTFKAIDVVESNAYNYDVAVNQANDDFAVATNRQVIVWSLPERQ